MAKRTARIRINGQEHVAPEGARLIEAMRSAGVEVPHLCDDPRLAPAAVCRLCLVEVEGNPRPLPSCSTPVAEGMSVWTHTAALEAERRMVLTLLAWSCPPETAELPDKELNRVLRAYGLAGELRGPKVPERLDDSHPYLHVDLSRCIECYRCVRICDDLQGQFAWRVHGRGERTRVTPALSVTLRESPCVACGACADTCPTGAIVDRTLLERGEPARWTKTTCSYCGVGCELWAGERDGRLVATRPVLEAPASKGHLCNKGRYAFDFVVAPDRVTTPLLREGGQWRRASWDEALEAVARGFERALAEAGPSSVAVLGSSRATNEENYLAQKFARVVLGTNNVDCCARVCHAPSAAALRDVLGTGAATNSFDDVELARTLLVVGANATENHPVVGARIKQAARRGARLIVVDPRRIELAEYADLHLQLEPGSNVALLNAMAHVILEEGLYDEAFVARRVIGFEELRDFLRDWTPERAAPLCGVEADTLRAAARLYATERPAMSVHGLGLTEHVQGTGAVKALINLALLTGNVGRPGTGVNPLRGQNNVQGAAHMGCEPDHLAGFVPVQKGADAAEAVWGVRPPSARGLNLMQMMDEALAGRLKALWAIGYDLLQTNPTRDVTLRALRALDLLVVQDLFLCETAREVGTVFLPACSSFEKDGTFMNGERRVQRVRKVLPPAGESRSDWEIIGEVARRMGRGRGFDFPSAEAIWEEVRKLWKPGAGISYARLDAGGLQWPCPSEDHPGTRLLHVDRFSIGERAALQRVEYRPSPEAPTEEYPFALSTGRSLYQFNAGTMTGRTPNRELRPTDVLEMSPEDARRLGLADGARVRVSSRHGETTLPLEVTPRVRPGELFATFQTPELRTNALVGPGRDEATDTPEYKLTAVRVTSSST